MARNGGGLVILDLYFSVNLPNDVLTSLGNASEELLEDLQMWNKSTEEIVGYIDDLCLSEKVYLARQGDISIMFLDKTPYTLLMYILAPKGINKNKIIRHLQETLSMFRDKTDIHKIEIFSTCPDVCHILAKCGFTLEGTLVDSRRVPTGEFVDEYAYGYLVDV